MGRTRCRKSRKVQGGSNRNLRAIVTYERLNPPRFSYIVPGNTIPIESRIATFLRAQAPITHEEVVWRGQATFPLNANSWFSTSKKDSIARSYGGRYLFKIHLMPGVHRLDMYDYYAQKGIADPRTDVAFQSWNLNMSNNYTEFAEVIVGSGGTFWKDAEQTKEGFKGIGTMPVIYLDGSEDPTHLLTVYETWYFMD